MRYIIVISFGLMLAGCSPYVDHKWELEFSNAQRIEILRPSSHRELITYSLEFPDVRLLVSHQYSGVTGIRFSVAGSDKIEFVDVRLLQASDHDCLRIIPYPEYLASLDSFSYFNIYLTPAKISRNCAVEDGMQFSLIIKLENELGEQFFVSTSVTLRAVDWIIKVDAI